MKKEESLLIEICRAYLDESDIPVFDEIEWQELFRLAKHHNLLGVCCCVLNKSKYKELIPKEFLNSVKNKFFDYVYIYECQKRCMDEVDAVLKASKIRYILFKGAALRNLYPVPESRSMGDIDLLIDKENRNRVKTLLINAGFICTEQNGPVYNYRKDNVLLEVHTQIISEFGGAFDNAFENAVFDGYKGVLDNNYHLAYLIAHTAHHFKFYGAGIRHVLDLAVMQKKREIDISKVLGILEGLNLDKFAKVILSVCAEWFNVGSRFIDDTSKTQQYLCSCGVFGSLQENIGAIAVRKEMEKNKSISPLALKLKLAFPPYEKLKNINYIKFIEGRPWLTPYAWCYRIFYNLKNRKKFMSKAISEIDNKNTHDLARQELAYFEEIGLL